MAITTTQRRAAVRARRRRDGARLFMCACLSCALAVGPLPLAAQPATAPPAAASAAAAPSFQQQELDALVAPIALYPDAVLAQVLMASTYPLEIVYAYRWMKANPSLKGEAAVKAVADKPWDVSVKSLVGFPQVLEPMNDKLDWTQKLGDAFLAQQKDVMDAVQRLRAKANESGNLKTTEQQKVIVEPATGTVQQTVIRIEPANPEVVYVPVYDPTVVYGYGYWGYAYPPYYWPPYPAYYPGYAFGAGLAFGFGLAVAGAIFGNITWGGGGDINIDIDRATNIDRNFDRNKVDHRGGDRGGDRGSGRWQHDASHRQGVSYRDNATREKFGQGGAGGADKRAAFRGHEGGRGGIGGGRGDGPGGAGAGGAGPGGAGPGGAGPGGGRGDGIGGGAGSSAGRNNAFQGVGGGNASQRDFSRGQSTAQRSSFNRPSGGGGMRGGGGGGRGGGGRR